MDIQLLKEVIADQHARSSSVKCLIKRSVQNELTLYKNSKQIVIITGLRRCGKSTLLEQIRSESGDKDYYLNFDDDRLIQFQIKDFQILFELFVELFGKQSTFYFDEIQNIPEWERFIRRLHDEGYKIYITGSNASMLSKELGTRLTGRYVEINLYPFSFEEFLAFTGRGKLSDMPTTIEKGLIKASFNEFLEKGGLPEVLNNAHPEYLHNLYESILYRDIIVRHKVNNHTAIKELAYYLASHIGKECTYNALRKTLCVASPSTISDYSAYLEDSFLCFLINRFDYSLKSQLISPKKIYFIDQALAVKIGFRFSADHGRLLENIVFLELKRRGYEIFYHRKKYECDFIVRKDAKIIAAIQVCLDLVNTKTKKREIEGITEAMQEYKLDNGLIITLDTLGKEGDISFVPIWRWLQQKD